MKIFNYLKLKRKYNRLLKKYEESEENRKFLFEENQKLKVYLRGKKYE